MSSQPPVLRAIFDEFPSVSRDEWLGMFAHSRPSSSVVPDPSDHNVVFSAVNTEEQLPPIDDEEDPTPQIGCLLEVPLTRTPDRGVLNGLVQSGAKGLRISDHDMPETIRILPELDHPFSWLSLEANSLTSDSLPSYWDYLREITDRHGPVRGTVYSPVARIAHWQNDSSTLDSLVALLKEVTDLPTVHVVTVPGDVFYEQGASAIDQLAMVLSWWVAYCDQLTDVGITIEDVLARTEITLATGTDFFVDMAKFRAMRVLVNKIAEAYGADAKHYRRPTLRMVSGMFNKTLYDPDSNILRNTTEALAAVLGGAHVLSLRPHDFLYPPSGDFGSRLTTQVYNILEHEAHASQVHDPAAGSFFIEDITRQLVERSWETFLSYEQQGGFQKLLRTGSLDVRCQQHRTALFNQVATQQRIVVGANRYTNALEQVAVAYDESPQRAVASFETLRYTVDQRVARGDARPTVALWIQQEASAVGLINQRVNYVKDLLTSVGFAYEERTMVVVEDFMPVEASDTPPSGVVFCGTDAFYESTVTTLCKQENAPYILVAGGSRVVAETIRQAGGRGAVGVGYDVISLLAPLIEPTKDEA